MTLILVEVWLIQAKEMPLNSFVILVRKRLQRKCYLVEFVKMSRTVVVASENT